MYTLAAGGADTHDMLMTMVMAISAGVLLIFIARRVGIPGIVLLLAGGVALGPAGLGWLDPAALGDGGLRVIVALSIGIILFEGGLTLDTEGYRSAPRMIRRLLTFGVLITWFGTATAIWLLNDVSYQFAIIAASLVIVTGPTVIAPLLKRIQIEPRLHSVLHWEGVLIDPIGVFIAVLCFEWLSEQGGQGALVNLAIRLGAGLIIGVPGGWVMGWLIRRRIVPEDMINTFALGAAVLIFGVAEAVLNEAGLLAVTAAGFVFGASGSVQARQVKRFKGELIDLLIGTLFILLAARLSFEQFRDFGWRGALAVAIVMLLVRPLSILVCSVGTTLTARDKVFLSWVAPRGIVAASMASLFALRMGELQFDNPLFVETFTYSVIICTIVLQGLSAGLLARLLGLKRVQPRGWLIVGSHELSRRLARFMQRSEDGPIVLIDTNARAVREAQLDGLTAIEADARDVSLADRAALQGVGNVLAMTDNEDLNARVCQSWRETVGERHVFRCNTGAGEVERESTDESGDTGRLLWRHLPKPSLLSGEVLRGEARLRVMSTTPTAGSVAMAAIIDGHIELDPPPEKLTEVEHILSVRREADYLVRALKPELIVTLKASHQADLLGQLMDLIASVEPKLERDEVFTHLHERERVFPTVVGEGVAAPHAHCDALPARLCAIARVPDGVDYAGDGQMVTLVFLLLSPSGDPEGHLATLADIARLVIDPAVREQLREAGSAAATIHAIRQSH